MLDLLAMLHCRESEEIEKLSCSRIVTCRRSLCVRACEDRAAAAMIMSCSSMYIMGWWWMGDIERAGEGVVEAATAAACWRQL